MPMRKVGETSDTELLSLKTSCHNKKIYTNSERKHLSRRGEFRFFFTRNVVSKLLEVSMRKVGETSETELLSLTVAVLVGSCGCDWRLRLRATVAVVIGGCGCD